MARNPNAKRCGARARQKGGAPCTQFVVRGAKRCRMHGGKVPRGGAAVQALTSLKHGLFAKTMTPEEEERFAEALQQAIDDPTKGMLADAQFLRVKAATVASRADKDGMYIASQSGTKRTEPMLNANGMPITYQTDDGETRQAFATTETVTAERQDVIGPVSELLMRAARLTEGAVMLKKKAGIIGADEVGELDESTMAEIMEREFNDRGALKAEDDDGSKGTEEPPAVPRR